MTAGSNPKLQAGKGTLSPLDSGNAKLQARHCLSFMGKLMLTKSERGQGPLPNLKFSSIHKRLVPELQAEQLKHLKIVVLAT
jgi:hypothetical protein